MELSQLKTFVTVAEEAHLTRAAERLFTSQPAISAQLKALEESLGVLLFDRTPKGMRLTPAGETLLVQAKITLDAAGNMLNKARAIQGEIWGSLSVGVNSDYEFLRITDLLKATHACHAGIQLSFYQGMTPDILQDIRKGKLDSGFYFGPCQVSDLHVQPLAQVKTAIVAPAAWADKVEHATLEQLANLPWIYTTQRCPFVPIVEKILSTAAKQIAKVVYVDHEDAIRHFIKAGAGIALLREDDAIRAESEGWGTRWHNPTPPIALSVAVLSRRLQEPLIRAWLDILQTLWPATADSGVCREAG
ncbi:MAG: LysR family transcriptional regulator [Hahellaceae bacterium]|nr:LysR family transcriptional regulator [Hahellaceae bacterium]MCP5169712.1 LysR family transcriptional regulator [Hahellaceae bacterium]